MSSFWNEVFGTRGELLFHAIQLNELLLSIRKSQRTFQRFADSRELRNSLGISYRFRIVDRLRDYWLSRRSANTRQNTDRA